MHSERYLIRDRSYGNWHRRRSIARFLDAKQAGSLTVVDLDSVAFVEYEASTCMPVCLIECARDVGQTDKPANVLLQLAQLARLPAFCVLYTHAGHSNPTNENWPDIASFRVRRLWPHPESSWRILTPQE